MKRFLSYLSLCFFCCIIVFSAGCSNKSMTCTSTESIDGNSNLSQKYIIYFDDDKLERILIDVNVLLNESDERTVSAIETYVGKAFEDYKYIDGINYNSIIRTDGFNISIDANFRKIKKSDMNKISFINYEKSYQELKSDFENNKFECK